jgi:hypothetical protein
MSVRNSVSTNALLERERTSVSSSLALSVSADEDETLLFRISQTIREPCQAENFRCWPAVLAVFKFSVSAFSSKFFDLL